MRKQRRKFSASFKAEVALEAIKEKQTLSELSERFGLHAQQISNWKQEFLEKSPGVFEAVAKKEKETVDVEKLYAKIGQLEMERDFLKKVQERFR
ncbi:MAG: transposase [Cytophagales bacterium]|nr:transposase [Cytophagales bacterium]